MKYINRRCLLTGLIFWIAACSPVGAATSEYLKNHLRPTLPRLVLTPETVQLLKEKIRTDPAVSNMYCAIRRNAETIQDEPLLERIKDGHRLLAVSREMVCRANMLGMVYCVEKDPQVLARLNDEVTAVCAFSDWNPSHFLDVGEMSLGVSLALDWTAGDLPPETVELAENALIEKGLRPSFEKEGYNWWIQASNNWSQVCHGGMIAAAITVAERDPGLSFRTVCRAVENLHRPLSVYAPDGAYPEGPGYWEYGTLYFAIADSMLESAFGTDFGLSDSPGFMDSAMFRILTETPNGFYNYSDCPDKTKGNEITLAWFAVKTGNAAFYREEIFRCTSERINNFSGIGLAWLAQYQPTVASGLPAVWRGRGLKPVVVFTGGAGDPRPYYFAAVGGRAALSHGDMDGGSFIFELDGIRWGIDCGNRRYEDLEKAGYDRWSMEQNSPRWKLLTKGNLGHSTITVNRQPYRVDGKTELIDFKAGETPSAVFDMTPAFGDLAESVQRTFTKDSPVSLIVEDRIRPSAKTEQITWQFMTTADVEIISGGATLMKNGKTLTVENLAHPEIPFAVVPLDPPPMEVDRHIRNLKRIELCIPVSNAEKDVILKTRLCGAEMVKTEIN